jgi:hypothetical protein
MCVWLWPIASHIRLDKKNPLHFFFKRAASGQIGWIWGYGYQDVVNFLFFRYIA